MTGVELGIAAVVVAIGAAVQGGVGFGMNLIAAPILAVLDPTLVPGPALAAALVLTILVAARDRATIDRRGVSFALAGRVPGTVIGALLIASIPDEGVTVTVGLAVLLAVALNATRLGLRPTPPVLLTAGVVSGFASTVSSVGGPPMAVVYANEPGPVIRGTLSFIFVIGAAMSLVALVAVGDFGTREAGASLFLMVPGTLGFLASGWVAGHVDRGKTRTAVLAVAALGALTALAKYAL
ncbi:MAG TPA: sulfite exporter TauE/SafE family protein [Acidimicrobiales bacterium]|nr:sulfite exporter TauE/SafE family protein [Acidimicrobiales bacterium]